MHSKYEQFAREVEASVCVAPGTFDAIRDLLGTDGSRTAFSPDGDSVDMSTVERVLASASVNLPGWTVHLTGKADALEGHWKCTIRKSESSDDDEFIGIGEGPWPSRALLAALIRTVSHLRLHQSSS